MIHPEAEDGEEIETTFYDVLNHHFNAYKPLFEQVCDAGKRRGRIRCRAEGGG